MTSDLRARVEALADDLWRVAPCGCGHRADLHTMGHIDISVCTGGLGLCDCSWSFVRIVQERIRALLTEPAAGLPERQNPVPDASKSGGMLTSVPAPAADGGEVEALAEADQREGGAS